MVLSPGPFIGPSSAGNPGGKNKKIYILSRRALKKEYRELHHPGVEPGSRAWKAHILTVGLMEHEDGVKIKIY
jgi:hypothetical protein